MRPIDLKNGLLARGYSDESANIITAQYYTDGRTGTEIETWQDVRAIIEEYNEAPLLSFMAHGKTLARYNRKRQTTPAREGR